MIVVCDTLGLLHWNIIVSIFFLLSFVQFWVSVPLEALHLFWGCFLALCLVNCNYIQNVLVLSYIVMYCDDLSSPGSQPLKRLCVALGSVSWSAALSLVFSL